MGGAGAGGARPRGDRGRPELCGHVWDPIAQNQDRSARRGGAGGGVPHRRVSARARASATAREARQRLRIRTHCVRQRTATINLLRAMLRAEGLRLPRGAAARILARIDQLTLPPGLASSWRRYGT